MRDYPVEIDGLKLQVREYPGAGETIIFLHYGGGNLVMWQGVAPFFERAYRLVMPDLRGHGRSDKPPSGYHIDDMAGDIYGLMARLGIERAHVVGSSLGAEVGLSLAANHPESVVSLVCEGALYCEFGPYGIQDDTLVAVESVGRRLAKMRAEPESRYETPEALVQASRQSYEAVGWWNAAVEAVEAYDVCPAEDSGYTNSWRKWARDTYMQNYYTTRFEQYYRRLCCPVLMLPGERELQNERMRRAMQGLSQLPPQCQIVNIPGAVHAYGWLLDPQGYSQAVIGFLNKVSEALPSCA
ncbi:MAG: alpha/beta hydrolase [Chloroflexota bacterium]